uniref:Putative secreted protein n=1 Tax=Phlebotomus kandelakii TaxID=1109342 RepID=A0A6B2ECV8_9DIPT
MNLFSFLLFYFILIDFFSSISCSYARYHLNHNKVCPSSKLTKLYQFLAKPDPLFTDPTRATIVNYVWNTSKSIREFDDCSFKVQSRGRGGLYMVISRLHLRQNPSSRICTDFLRVRYTNGSKSERICGHITSKDVSSFSDSGGEVKLYLAIANHIPLEPNEMLEIEMVFTEYFACKGQLSPEFQCEPNNCIHGSFFSDGVNNCPTPQCLDEEIGCLSRPEVEAHDARVSKKVIVGGVISAVVVLIGFTVCILAICKFSACVKAPRRPSNIYETTQHRPQRIDTQELSAIGNISQTGLPTPSAPAAFVIEDHNKDPPPPSYESLFPHDPHTS